MNCEGIIDVIPLKDEDMRTRPDFHQSRSHSSPSSP
jgi:hypothetical protein